MSPHLGYVSQANYYTYYREVVEDIQVPKFDLTGSGFSSSQISEIISVTSKASYTPKTALGKKLVALREAAIAKGMRLMMSDEISAEIARRRGEIV